MKKITLFSLALAGLALLVSPHSGQAFELKEEWGIEGGVKYQDGKILRFNNGHEVDIKVLDLPKTEKIEWTVSLNGQNQTVNFLGQEKEHSMMDVEGRYLNFYVPYGYRGDIKVEAKSGNEVKIWSTKIVDDIHNDSGKRGYYRIEESNAQYTYLDTKWDYQTKTYTATLPETVNDQKVYAWADYDNGELKLEKLKSISHKYDGGSFKELYPVVKAEGWLQSYSHWYYQKQGQLVQNDWVKDEGTWYFMDDQGVMFNKTWLYQGGNWYAFQSSGAMIASDWLYDQGKWYYLSTSGAMKASTWVYDKGEWYYVSSSGAMIANDWVKDNGKWYYLASSGKMLRNTYTPDGYYVGNSGAWQ